MSGFRILTVCTGNVCRSPVAAQVLLDGLRELSDVDVDSAGTQALVGAPMPEPAKEISERFGGDPSTHAGVQLTSAAVEDANLVLAMAREHRRSIVELVPRASQYAFTVREFARLVRDVSRGELAEIATMPLAAISGRLAAAVTVASARRGEVDHPADPREDDVVDPYGQSEEVYRMMADQLAPAVQTTLVYLRRVASVTE